MTEIIRSDGCYQRPCIIGAPKGFQASGARYAIHRFSEEWEAEIYLPGHWKTECEDGRYARPKPIVIRFCGVIQPDTPETVVSEKEGERVEERLCLHVDPIQPENLAFAAKYPDLFPNGELWFSASDGECSGREGDSDIIRYNGCRWRILRSERNDRGGCDNRGGIHCLTLGLYRDRDGELDAQPEEQKGFCWPDAAE